MLIKASRNVLAFYALNLNVKTPALFGEQKKKNRIVIN